MQVHIAADAGAWRGGCICMARWMTAQSIEISGGMFLQALKTGLLLKILKTQPQHKQATQDR